MSQGSNHRMRIQMEIIFWQASTKERFSRHLFSCHYWRKLSEAHRPKSMCSALEQKSIVWRWWTEENVTNQKTLIMLWRKVNDWEDFGGMKYAAKVRMLREQTWRDVTSCTWRDVGLTYGRSAGVLPCLWESHHYPRKILICNTEWTTKWKRERTLNFNVWQ